MLCAGGAAVEGHIGARPIALLWEDAAESSTKGLASPANDRSQVLRIEGHGTCPASNNHLASLGLRSWLTFPLACLLACLQANGPSGT